MILCSGQSFFFFEIVNLYLAPTGTPPSFQKRPVVFRIIWYKKNTMGLSLTYIHDLYMTFTFGLNIKILYFHLEFVLGKVVLGLWHRHTIFGTWVYHHEKCFVHSWPLCDPDIKVHIGVFSHGYICLWLFFLQKDFTHSFLQFFYFAEIWFSLTPA